ncbi:MAG: hypothetical protein ACK5VT_03845 [Alphaproteobacteria bacterium]|jgi:hypothetical protein
MMEHVKTATPPTPQPVEASDAAPAMAAPTQNSGQTTPLGNWLVRHPRFTREPLSFTGYQFVRSTLATIPYGLGMAFIYHLMGLLSIKGSKIGLTEAGHQQFSSDFNKGGYAEAMKTLDNIAEKAKLHTPGIKGYIGRNMTRFANSPMNAALQIGLAFSMFRFVGSIVKTVRDKLTDPSNTPEDTQREAANWWKTAKEAMQINWKAEAIGTFWAALTLGFIGANFKQTTPYQRQAGEKFVDAVKRVWSKPSKLWQNGMLWAISYSAFFEVDERIQKDFKLREGTWKGHSNSLVNKPDVTVGMPPKKDEKGELAPVSEQPEKPRFGFFTNDPGLPRLIFRRVLPVAAGITAYAVLKRPTYVAAGGQMMPITERVAHSGLLNNLKHFGKNSWREGLATATFGVLWMATDAWGEGYDKFFAKLQHKNSPRPLTPEQSRNFAILQQKLDEKDRGKGVAA